MKNKLIKRRQAKIISGLNKGRVGVISDFNIRTLVVMLSGIKTLKTFTKSKYTSFPKKKYKDYSTHFSNIILL